LRDYLRHLHHDGMPSQKMPLPALHAMTDASRQRWDELLGSVAALLPDGASYVLIDGNGAQHAILAARLAAALNASGRACVRLPGAGGDGNDDSPCIPTSAIRLADDLRWRDVRSWDVVIWLRTAPASQGECRDGEDGADIVIDMHDPDWPVIRRVAAPLAVRGQWYLTETRAFFSCRAATWDAKFGDDLPAYAAAITQAGIRRGGTVIDVGCGTGRALPALRQAVGPKGSVIAVDLTPEMLGQARPQSQAARGALVLADARQLPFATASADAIFAAGLVNHLPDTETGLRELARVTRPGGLLVLFQPTGRAALAARHGRTPTPGEPLAAGPLRRSTQATGWQLTTYDDSVGRFFAVAVRP
jgi:protein-L-isoaspartate O-methyltransferase